MALNPAVVVDCHYNGLSTIQELGRHGVPVYALDTARRIGTVSRYAKFRRCPDIYHNEDQFIESLLEMGKTLEKPAVLFPSNDEFAISFARHKRELEKYYRPCVAEYPVVDLLIAKDKFYRWAMERNYPVPRMLTYDEIRSMGPESFPLVIKPKYKQSADSELNDTLMRLLEKNRMVVFKDLAAVDRFIADHPDLLGHMLFQEYVNGMADSMYTIGIYADRKSEVKGVFTGRKMRGYPPDIGDCIVGQAELLPKELVGMVRNIVKDLGYHGIAEFEFKKDTVTKEFKLIEINPRSWSWIGITPACGVSLPWIAYCDISGSKVPEPGESTVDNGDVKYIKLIQDFIDCTYLNKRSGYPQYHMGIGQWWRSLKSKKKVYAEFNLDDPVVGIYSFIYLARLYLSSRQRAN